MGDPPTGGHSGPVFAANPRAMQGFRGAPGGAFFGLQRVGPETALQWRNVSPMMLVMLAWRRPMMLLMLANDLVPPGCKSKSSSRLHFELHPPTWSFRYLPAGFK